MGMEMGIKFGFEDIVRAVDTIKRSEKAFWDNAPNPGFFCGELVADVKKARKDYQDALDKLKGDTNG